jgi:ADP-ribose pyrophosphatase YjhB (NUDIX family)
VPFSQTCGYSLPDGRLRHFRNRTHASGNETIEEAIREACEELGSEIETREQKVGSTFTWTGHVSIENERREVSSIRSRSIRMLVSRP